MPTSINESNKTDGGTDVTSTSMNFSSIASIDWRVPEVAAIIANRYVQWERGAYARHKPESKLEFYISGTRYRVYSADTAPVGISGYNSGVAAEAFRLIIETASTGKAIVEAHIPYAEVAAFDWTFTGVQIVP